MGRPSRCRRVCGEPIYQHFGPCQEPEPQEEPILLTVDEYEAIRLTDYEKKSHEQCAEQMQISRTTATEICSRAHFKIADSIIHGKPLMIAGGHYQICQGSESCEGRGCGHPCRWLKQTGKNINRNQEGVFSVKIAVTYENDMIFQHFGHTEQFKLVEVENGQIVKEEIVHATDGGHGALAKFLSDLNVEVLICGGIGAGAQNALAEAGIQLFGGVTGSVDDAVKAFLAGNLNYNADVRCEHHEHEHGHHEHHGHCGEDKHGCSGHGGACGA